MNKKKIIQNDAEIGYEIPRPPDETNAESERMPRSKEKEVVRGYPSETSGTEISGPVSEEHPKDKEAHQYGLAKPKRKIIKAKIAYD